MAKNNMLNKFIHLIKSGDHSKACAAFNESCDNECSTCPFGSEKQMTHLTHSFQVVEMMMGDSFGNAEED
jgi:hypothetical protein